MGEPLLALYNLLGSLKGYGWTWGNILSTSRFCGLYCRAYRGKSRLREPWVFETLYESFRGAW